MVARLPETWQWSLETSFLTVVKNMIMITSCSDNLTLPESVHSMKIKYTVLSVVATYFKYISSSFASNNIARNS